MYKILSKKKEIQRFIKLIYFREHITKWKKYEIEICVGIAMTNEKQFLKRDLHI